MSASRWAMCPRCRQNRRKEAEAAAEQARTAYGTVSVEEFQALHATAEELAARVDDPPNLEGETFREDYEITGAAQGAVTVSYGGGCERCGLTLSFEHWHTLDV